MVGETLAHSVRLKWVVGWRFLEFLPGIAPERIKNCGSKCAEEKCF